MMTYNTTTIVVHRFSDMHEQNNWESRERIAHRYIVDTTFAGELFMSLEWRRLGRLARHQQIRERHDFLPHGHFLIVTYL